jgi:hypothetical protein
MQLLECFGVGTVLENKDTDTDEVMIHCPQLNAGADGEALAQVNEEKASIKSPTGDTIASSGLSSNGIKMKWLPFNTNRVTAPDVRVGSKVVVYKFKGHSKYRWMYFGMDGTLRLETVIHAYSASPNVTADSPLTPDNYYIFLISSHKGQISLLTGQGNGEPASFNLTLNTKEGKFNLLDSEENLFALNSMEHCWSISNQDKSRFAINKKKIYMTAEDEILLQAKEHLGIKTKRLDIVVGETFNMQIGEATNLKSPNIFIEGNITHKGNTQQQGDKTQEGYQKSTGEISSDTDCVSAGISGKTHRHDQVQGGKDKSGKPVQG